MAGLTAKNRATSGGSGMDFLFDNDTVVDYINGGGGDDLLWSVNTLGSDLLDGNGGTNTMWYDGNDSLSNMQVDGLALSPPSNVGPHGYTEFMFGTSLSDNFVHKLSQSPQTDSFWTSTYAGTRSP